MSTALNNNIIGMLSTDSVEVVGVLPCPATKSNQGAADLLETHLFAYGVGSSVAVVEVSCLTIPGKPFSNGQLRTLGPLSTSTIPYLRGNATLVGQARLLNRTLGRK